MSRAENLAILKSTVERYGQPPEMYKFLTHIMAAESGGDTRAKNLNSSATGIFQFIKSTWDRYGNGGDIYDPRAQCDAVLRFTMDNKKILVATLGREPNAGEYYLAHFAGPGGARKALAANPATPITEVLSPDAIHANSKRLNHKQGIVFRGKDFADFNAGDLREWASSRMGVDMDARRDYQQRRDAGKTTRDEDDEERRVRRENLQSFGIDKKWLDQIDQTGTLGILGSIFFAILEYFLDKSAPPSERQQQEQSPPTVMRSVQKTQVAAVRQPVPERG